MRKLKVLLVAILAITLISSMRHQDNITAYAEEKYKDLQLFAKVLNLVQQYYVEAVDVKKLIYGGIKGMLKELDPHTNFLPPDLYKEFETETSGQFGGLGIEITLEKGVLTIISPIEDTPAYNAGLKAGDKITSINGESTKGFSLAEAAQKMRGSEGSTVKLGIFRDDFDEPKDFSVRRGVVKIKSVKYTDIENGYAYIKLTSFIENTSAELDKAINEHEKKHKGMKGLILDLRRNPGGLLDQAVKISDMFLEQGVIVSTIGRNKNEKEVVYAKKPNTRVGFPIIVLINEYSASASEILAGALRDNKRGLIMGKRSFGKGSVQSIVKLGDGSGLKLTVARYYTPSGVSIQAEGIVPDVEVSEMEVDEKKLSKKEIKREKDIQGHLLGEKEKKAIAKASRKGHSFWWDGADEKSDDKLSVKDKILKGDFQLIQAYNYLKAWNVMESLAVQKNEAEREPTTISQ